MVRVKERDSHMKLFERKIRPDFEGLRKCIFREKTPERVYFMEFIQDGEIKNAVLDRFALGDKLDKSDRFYNLKMEIILQRFLGYEMIMVSEAIPQFNLDLSPGNEGLSSVVSTDPVASGPIRTWNDFENYPWPAISSVDTRSLEWLEKNLPENMKCYSAVPIGYYKNLIGFEAMCYMIYDQPDLLKAVLSKIKTIFLDYCRLLSQFSCVGVMWGADDMGFKTQTFLPPEYVKEHILPIHQACAEVAHQSGKLYFLHSCGNLSGIMDAIINKVKIDGKHSFEDAIMPIEEAKILYGQSVALIGGIDVDFLCRSDEAAIRRRVRNVIDICNPGGGYCLGSGNSIAKYVPLENYLVMLDEGRKYGCV